VRHKYTLKIGVSSRRKSIKAAGDTVIHYIKAAAALSAPLMGIGEKIWLRGLKDIKCIETCVYAAVHSFNDVFMHSARDLSNGM
jgi:hypothetical protein